MGEPVIAPLTQMRGTARLTLCPECGEPHGLIYRLGQTPVVECATLKPREMRLHLRAKVVTIVVGAEREAETDPSTDKTTKPRRPA